MIGEVPAPDPRNGPCLDRRHFSERLSLFLLALPTLLIIFVVVLVPVCWLFYLSLLGDDGSFSLENYQKMLVQKSYTRTLVTTFWVSTLTTLICTVLGYPVAYILARLSPRRATLLLYLVLLPCLTSVLARTYAWLVLLQKQGLINRWAIGSGIWDAPLQLVYNMTGTLVGMVHVMLPILILTVFGGIKNIDKSYVMAASSLGANPRAAFWRVFFPLSAPALAAGTLIVFVLSLGFYLTPAILGGGRVMMVSNQITAILENQFDWGVASALGMVLLVLCLALLSVIPRLFRLGTRFFSDQ